MAKSDAAEQTAPSPKDTQSSGPSFGMVLAKASGAPEQKAAAPSQGRPGNTAPKSEQAVAGDADAAVQEQPVKWSPVTSKVAADRSDTLAATQQGHDETDSSDSVNQKPQVIWTPASANFSAVAMAISVQRKGAANPASAANRLAHKEDEPGTAAKGEAPADVAQSAVTLPIASLPAPAPIAVAAAMIAPEALPASAPGSGEGRQERDARPVTGDSAASAENHDVPGKNVQPSQLSDSNVEGPGGDTPGTVTAPSGVNSSQSFALPQGVTGVQAVLLPVMPLPGAAAIGSTDHMIQPASGSNAGNKVADEVPAKASDGTNSTPDAKSTSSQNPGATTGSGGTTTSATPGSMSGSSSSQHTPADPSQPLVSAANNAAARGSEAAPAPAAANGGQPAAHDSAMPSRSATPGDLAHATDTHLQADSPQAAAASGINTSRVIQTMGESEMRVGLRSTEFGDISIRTSVSQQQMLAQISVDHNDLGKAISEHLPAVQAKLGDNFGLRASIEVSQTGMSFSGERGYSSQQEQRSFAPSFRTEGAAVSTEAEPVAMLSTVIAGDGYRLDIRA